MHTTHAWSCCDGVCNASAGSDSRRSSRQRAVDDDTVRQQAPAAEAQRLDLPFESEMKSYSGGSTGGTAAAGTLLGPSKSTLISVLMAPCRC